MLNGFTTSFILFTLQVLLQTNPPPLDLYKTVHESIAEELLKQHRL